MTTETVVDLRRLHEEATPEPWVVQRPEPNDPGAGTTYIDTHASECGPEPVFWVSSDGYHPSEADAALIAAARNALPYLLDVVEAARAPGPYSVRAERRIREVVEALDAHLRGER